MKTKENELWIDKNWEKQPRVQEPVSCETQDKVVIKFVGIVSLQRCQLLKLFDLIQLYGSCRGHKIGNILTCKFCDVFDKKNKKKLDFLGQEEPVN